jgi:7-cyano-7-deazaguanine synthase
MITEKNMPGVAKDTPELKPDPIQDVVVLLSGGMDSTTLLYYLLDKKQRVHPLILNYGQLHSREVSAAFRVSQSLRLKPKVVDISAVRDLISSSALTGHGEVPEGHYTDEVMKQTVVPNRNMIFLSLAIGYAINIKANCVAYAAHSGDHSIYPDCRPQFVGAMRDAAELCDYQPVQLVTPFLSSTKTDIVKIGVSLGVPFVDTWSCYRGGEYHCGCCGTCWERIEAFIEAKVQDPTTYNDVPSELLKKKEEKGSFWKHKTVLYGEVL